MIGPSADCLVSDYRMDGWEREDYTCIKMTSAPHSARAIAAACPIPLVPPVIKAVCPSRENIEKAAGTAIIARGSKTNRCLECVGCDCIYLQTSNDNKQQQT